MLQVFHSSDPSSTRIVLFKHLTLTCAARQLLLRYIRRNYIPSTMATLADELLNDFDDSGSETGEHDQNGFLEDNVPSAQDDASRNGRTHSTSGMELDGDEEEIPDAEEELAAQNNTTDLKDAPNEEETKARVEKMRLGGVSDVRNVAGLMKTLQPILEVRYTLLPPSQFEIFVFTSLPYSNPDMPPSFAENRPLPIHPSGKEDNYSRLHRRQP